MSRVAIDDVRQIELLADRLLRDVDDAFLDVDVLDGHAADGPGESESCHYFAPPNGAAPETRLLMFA